MPTMVRMGARVLVAAHQTPLGYGTPRVVTRDERGREVAREERRPDPTELDVVAFVDLDDGRRVTTRGPGAMTLSMPLDDCSEQELRDEVRECLYEEDERATMELPEEPRWDDIEAALRAHGVACDDRSLAALPFVVEFGDDVLDLLGPDEPGVAASTDPPGVRAARPEDVGLVVELWRESRDWEGHTDDPDSLESLVHHDPCGLLVAELDARIVGSLICGLGRLAGKHVSPHGAPGLPGSRHRPFAGRRWRGATPSPRCETRQRPRLARRQPRSTPMGSRRLRTSGSDRPLRQDVSSVIHRQRSGPLPRGDRNDCHELAFPLFIPMTLHPDSTTVLQRA